MDIAINTINWLPVLLTSSVDFHTGLTGISYSSSGLQVKYQKEGGTLQTKTLTSGDWVESTEGGYMLRFTGSELDTQGMFQYFIIYPNAITYAGAVRVSLVVNAAVPLPLPVAQDGGTLHIMRGDDYQLTEERQLDWQEDELVGWPALTGATVKLIIGEKEFSGSVIVSNPQMVRFELDAVDTASLTAGVAVFWVKVTLTNTHVITLVSGKAHISDEDTVV